MVFGAPMSWGRCPPPAPSLLGRHVPSHPGWGNVRTGMGCSEGMSLDPEQQLTAVADVGHDLLFELGHLLPEETRSV